MSDLSESEEFIPVKKNKISSDKPGKTTAIKPVAQKIKNKAPKINTKNQPAPMKTLTSYIPSWMSLHYPTIKPLDKSHPDHPNQKKKLVQADPSRENHFVYMIQEREFLHSGEPVYKIGKTTQLPNSRLAGYPKGSRIIYYIDVSFSGCHFMEKQLITEFDRLYIQRADIGRESYEGDLEKMKATFLRIVKETDHLTEVPTNPVGGFLWKSAVYAWRILRK